MKKAAAIVAVSLAGGVGIGIGQGLVSGGQIPGQAWAQNSAVVRRAAAFTPLSDEEESVIRVARQARPAVVSVFQGRGGGSGVLIRQDGVILTNAHVVGDAERVGVQLASGERKEGRVVGRDRGVDIAVVKIEGSDLPALPLADSDALAVGQAAIAIGNPLGYERSVTTGVVSGVGRAGGPGGGVYNEGFIQTDAAINPGNSGGPLLDTRGRVMGINSWIIRGSRGGGGAQGLGFAVPINVAKTVTDQLLSTGRSWRALLGVSYNDVDPEMASAFHLPVAQGVVVSEVPDGSPSGRAGVRKGDIITRIEETTVRSGGDLRRVLRGRRPGETVRLSLRRGDEAKSVSVRLAAAPTAPEEGDEE
jgi:serine protease Do